MYVTWGGLTDAVAREEDNLVAVELSDEVGVRRVAEGGLDLDLPAASNSSHGQRRETV